MSSKDRPTQSCTFHNRHSSESTHFCAIRVHSVQSNTNVLFPINRWTKRLRLVLTRNVRALFPQNKSLRQRKGFIAYLPEYPHFVGIHVHSVQAGAR